MSQISLGMNGTVSRMTTGTRAAWAGSATNGVYVAAPPASLSTINAVRNVTLNLGATEANTSNRGSGWKLSRQALKEASIDFEIPWNNGDAGFQALLQAYAGGTSIALAVLDGPCATGTSSEGLWADFAVMAFNRDEPIESEMIAKVTVKPTDSAVPPQYVQCE